MNADGSGARRLTPRGRRFSSPVWSPDGRQIALESWAPRTSTLRRGEGIYLIDADGRNLRRLVRGHQHVLDWSRDGRYLLTRAQAFVTVMYEQPPALLNVRTGRYTQTRANRSIAWGDARFLSDGTQIVFASRYDRIYIASLDGRRWRLVTRVRGAAGVSISPDAQSIAFDTRAAVDADIFVVAASGANRRAVLSSAHADFSPDWRP